MLDNLIKKSHEYTKECVFEIGSNSDLILEDTVTDTLSNTIEEFAKKGRGAITFPTKFGMSDKLLGLRHNGKVIFRMSLNPQELIKSVEIGTSPLFNRINALNSMCEAGYQVGILIAPVILVENWKALYAELLDILEAELTQKTKDSIFIEIIFMTYSYVQNAINNQAFPDSLKLYNKEIMTGRGRGKYCYKESYRLEAETFLRDEIDKRFKSARIIYVV
jgi:spore photoproduct lyase